MNVRGPGAILLSLGLCLVSRAGESPSQEPNVHEIEATGWGVSPPAGFVPAEGLRGAWKPSAAANRGQPLARNSMIRAYSAFSAEACRSLCAGRPVPKDMISRSVIRGKPVDSFHCRQTVFHLGMAWTYSDYTIVHLEENACVILALLARSGEARHQALQGLAALRRTLAPVPKPASKREAEEADKKAPLLR